MAVSRYIFSRISNVLRCYASYALSLFGSVHFAHRPLFVSVEPAAVCQLHCPECPVGNRSSQKSSPEGKEQRTPFLSREVWERILTQAAPYAHTMQFYFQGEPLLHKDLPAMIAQAHAVGLYTIVSTNAQAMTPEIAEELVTAGLNRIIVSMDGLTDASYNAYRIGGRLDKCKEALRWLRQAKDKQPRVHNRYPVIELQCLRLRSNEHEWETFRHEYKALGADRLVFKTAQLYDYAHGHPLMPSDPHYSRYIKGPDGLFHRRRLGHGCLRVWSGVVVTTNGDVLPCCYDKDHAHAYGNIMNESLAALFTGDKALAFRKAALREQPSICQECYK